MKDKNCVAIVTLISMILYFYPFTILKFITLGILLFFSPGFFLLKMLYDDMPLEELIPLSIGVSFGLSGSIALLLAAIGMLSPLSILIVISFIIIFGYIFSSPIDIHMRKFAKPSKFAVVITSLMLIVASTWLYMEFSTKRYREIDIGLISWPENSTINDTLNFGIYLKNWNYGSVNCTVVFYLNNRSVDSKSAFLKNGDEAYLFFKARSNITGKNLALFKLYVNGRYLTNVHIYFYLRN